MLQQGEWKSWVSSLYGTGIDVEGIVMSVVVGTTLVIGGIGGSSFVIVAIDWEYRIGTIET